MKVRQRWSLFKHIQSEIFCISALLNAVPSECSIYLDRRLAREEALEQVQKEIDMPDRIQYIKNSYKSKEQASDSDFFQQNELEAVREFHRSFPEYQATPLVPLRCLADEAGIKQIFVKDESRRFGLNAFKVLGGSYCVGKYLAEEILHISRPSYELLRKAETREKFCDTVFVTATDGNHGRGIAWVSQRLGIRCVVYMPSGSSKERLDNIKKLGADAYITEWNYDDTVRYAQKQAERNGWILVQDTSWEGYETIPRSIMYGYTTMAMETAEQLRGVIPTHIFLQAGVGAMAGALTGFFSSFYKECPPQIIIVESDQADCLYQTMKANDGTLHKVTGSLSTIMAGLACGEPCGLGWAELSRAADYFFSIPDRTAERGMRRLAYPSGEDKKIISGESGAAAFGLALELLTNQTLQRVRQELDLNENSVVLCFSTEGDTDRTSYQKIVGAVAK